MRIGQGYQQGYQKPVVKQQQPEELRFEGLGDMSRRTALRAGFLGLLGLTVAPEIALGQTRRPARAQAARPVVQAQPAIRDQYFDKFFKHWLDVTVPKADEYEDGDEFAEWELPADILSALRARNRTMDGLKNLIRERYWVASGADKLPDRDLAVMHADAFHSHGKKAATWFLREAQKQRTSPYEYYKMLRLAAYEGSSTIPEDHRQEPDRWEERGDHWLNRLDSLDTVLEKVSEDSHLNIYRIRVERGDMLLKLADQYHVSQAAIQAFNRVDPRRLQIGDILRIPQYVHKVKSGESLSQIAAKFHVDEDVLIQTNDIEDPDTIRIGERINIPIFVHTVQPGEALSQISEDTPFTPRELANLNDIDNPASIQPGQKIIIPGTRQYKSGSESDLAKGGRSGTPSVSGRVFVRPSRPAEPEMADHRGAGGVFAYSPVRGPIPAEGRLNAPRASGSHTAVDIYAPVGSPIVAPRDGIVLKIKRGNGRAGNTLDLYHGRDPRTGKALYTRYFHNSEILVRKGQRVEAGDVIARVGTSGMPKGGGGVAHYRFPAFNNRNIYSHLHFEVHAGGIRGSRTRQNPMPYLPDLRIYDQRGDFTGKRRT